MTNVEEMVTKRLDSLMKDKGKVRTARKAVVCEKAIQQNLKASDAEVREYFLNRILGTR